MAKGKRRKAAQASKQHRKRSAMDHPSGKSKYGRKKEYCTANGVFGFQVSDPKPWR